MGGGGENSGLATEVWGHVFANPIGLAAGFDKHAQAAKEIFKLGFGFVELGGVTLHAQPGNPKPRLFRLTEDQAIINRMGLNSVGLNTFASALRRQREYALPGPVAVNLGLNKGAEDPASDYAALAEGLAPLADILTINVSSPNTPGLRTLQDPAKLSGILNGVRDAAAHAPHTRNPVVLVKVAPDLEQQDIEDMCEFAEREAVSGLVVSNTTVARPPSLQSKQRAEAGGLSGAPLFDPSTELLRVIHQQTGGRIPLVGVGGIGSGQDALAKIKAGASLVQLYSALVYQGPSLVRRMKDSLRVSMEMEGGASISDVVGTGQQASDIA